MRTLPRAALLGLGLSLASCELFQAEESAPPPVVGCGELTAFGRCDGTRLSFCRDDQVESRDCMVPRYGITGTCGLVSESWGFDCITPIGGQCASMDPNAPYVAWCEGEGSACLAEGSDVYRCVAGAGSCAEADVGTWCGEGIALHTCHGGVQPVGVRCWDYALASGGADGEGCVATACVGLPAGEACYPELACAEGAECRDGRCVVPGQECENVVCSDLNAYCVPAEGTFTCVCRSGYDADPSGRCLATDAACERFECVDPNSECAAVKGALMCVCKPGFQRNPATLACE